MNVKVSIAALLSSAASLAVLADGGISISDVTFAQSGNRNLTIEYLLTGEESAYITVDVLTNGVSIGGANLTHLVGDVNKFVSPAPDLRRRVTWVAKKDWPDHLEDNTTVQVNAWTAANPLDYLVIDLATGDRTYYPGADWVPGGVTNDVYKTTKMVMRLIPAAGETFIMGAPSTEYNWNSNREYQHSVTFTNDYYMAIYEFTQGQWAALGLGAVNKCSWSNPGEKNPCDTNSWVRGRCDVGGYNWPVNGHNLNMTQTNRLLVQLRTKTASDFEFDFPTEAQWEYACRAGTTTAYNTGLGYPNTDAVELKKICWYKGNSDSSTHEVGLKEPNAWGLYDMHGNVWEWCLDYYVLDMSTFCDATQTAIDPTGPIPASGTARTIRGGAYTEDMQWCRSAQRGNYGHSESTKKNIGYRIVCPAVFKLK